MNWDEQSWDRGEWELWRDLVRLRQTSQALACGSYQLLVTGWHTLAFVREAGPERLVVVARRANEANLDRLPVWAAAIPEGTVFGEFFSGQQARVENGYLPIGEGWTQIWRQVERHVGP